MCFRLLAAVRDPRHLPAGTDPPEEPPERVLEQLALKHGLDVRVAPAGGTRFVEIAWGACACSLYTGKRGRERVVGFVEELLTQGLAVHLLLYSDGEPLDWSTESPVSIETDDFRYGGLGALPEGKVAQLLRPPTHS